MPGYKYFGFSETCQKEMSTQVCPTPTALEGKVWYFWSESAAKCQQCAPGFNCAGCEGSSDNCLKCQAGFMREYNATSKLWQCNKTPMSQELFATRFARMARESVRKLFAFLG